MEKRSKVLLDIFIIWLQNVNVYFQMWYVSYSIYIIYVFTFILKKIIHVQNDTKNNTSSDFTVVQEGVIIFVSKLLYIYCWVEEHVIYLIVVTLWVWCLVVNEVSWWMSQVTMSFFLVFKFNSKWNTLLFEFLQVLFWLPFLKPIKRIWCEEHEGFALIRRVRGDNLFLFIFFVNCICLCVQKLEACAVNYFNKLCKLNLCSYFNN